MPSAWTIRRRAVQTGPGSCWRWPRRRGPTRLHAVERVRGVRGFDGATGGSQNEIAKILAVGVSNAAVAPVWF